MQDTVEIPMTSAMDANLDSALIDQAESHFRANEISNEDTTYQQSQMSHGLIGHSEQSCCQFQSSKDLPRNLKNFLNNNDDEIIPVPEELTKSLTPNNIDTQINSNDLIED